MNWKEWFFRGFIVFSILLGLFALRVRKLEEDHIAERNAQIVEAKEASKAAFDACGNFHSKVLMPLYGYPDPVAPQTNFGRATIDSTWETGVEEVQRELKRPFAPAELFPKGAKLEDAMGVVARRQDSPTHEHVFALVLPEACGVSVPENPSSKFHPAVYLIFERNI